MDTVAIRHQVTSERRRRVLPSRSAPAIGAAMAFALGLAACGGPSAAQTASQELNAGIAAQKAHDYGTATTDYEKVLKAEPKNKYALYDLGDVEQFEGQDAAAATHYLKALAVDPNFELAIFNLGVLSQATHPAIARTLFEQALRIDPRDSFAHLHLGKVLIALGLKKQGDQQIRKAIQLNPSLASQAPPGS